MKKAISKALVLILLASCNAPNNKPTTPVKANKVTAQVIKGTAYDIKKRSRIINGSTKATLIQVSK